MSKHDAPIKENLIRPYDRAPKKAMDTSLFHSLLLLYCFPQLFKDRFQLLFGAALGQSERHGSDTHG